jgi:hypothetical protein
MLIAKPVNRFAAIPLPGMVVLSFTMTAIPKETN